MRLAGLVLAGGRSIRFGREKAVEPWRGRSFLEHALDRLSGCEARAVNAVENGGAAALAARLGLPRIGDMPGDALGPLSGVKAGLIWAAGLGCEALAVVPCDAPILPLDLVAKLVGGLGDARAAYAETDAGTEPLCSVWRVAALPMLVEALAGGAHPGVGKFLDRLGAVPVRFEDPKAFANLNRVEDLDAIAVPGPPISDR